MRTFKLTIAYDGSRFVGWQRQAAGASVQGLLEAALAPFHDGPATVHGAGRTDAGVHALGQVASVGLDTHERPETLLRACNARLPPDVRVLRIDETPADFHARFSARRKTYRYLLHNAPLASPFARAYAWHLAEPLQVDAMRAGAEALHGRHDFAAFRSTGGEVQTTVRTIFRSAMVDVPPCDPWIPAGPGPGGLLAYVVEGDGFLRHMVRAIVGTLVAVGRGWREPAEIAALLRHGARADAGATAPAHGLYLVRVDYD